MGVLIFCATPSDIFEIWLWIYICHVSDVHQPFFLNSGILISYDFISIAPHVRSECAPIMFG